MISVHSANRSPQFNLDPMTVMTYACNIRLLFLAAIFLATASAIIPLYRSVFSDTQQRHLSDGALRFWRAVLRRKFRADIQFSIEFDSSFTVSIHEYFTVSCIGLFRSRDGIDEFHADIMLRIFPIDWTDEQIDVAVDAEWMAQSFTTVFVGNITENCSNELIEKLLQICGPVHAWKRLQDTNGKYQAFGFCEFQTPDGTLHALRVLNKLQLGDKKLTVKTDEVTSKMLEDFQAEKRKAHSSGASDSPDEELANRIMATIKEENPSLLEADRDEDSRHRHNADSRASHRSSRSRSRSYHSRSRSRRSVPKRQRSSSSQRCSASHSRRSRSPDSKRKRSSRRRYPSEGSSGSPDGFRSSHSSSPSTSRERRSNSRHSRRHRSGSGHYRRRRSDSLDASADYDDVEERRRLKAEIKRKEQSYLKRLEKWEEREHRMAKQYERDEENEIERRKMIQREAKKLRQFLEDYDDERDDPKYYKSSSLIQRRRNYERERELDIRDRQDELKEIEELKRQILAERTNVDDVEAEAIRLYEARTNQKLKTLRGHSGSPTPHRPLGHQPVNGASAAQNGSPVSSNSIAICNAEGSDDKMDVDESVSDVDGEKSAPMNEAEPSDRKNAVAAPVAAESSVSGSSVGKMTLQKPMLAKVNGGIFGDDDDEEEQQAKRKIKPFEITREDRIQAMTPEERKKMIKEVIERIPTTIEPLFAFGVSWEHVDESLMERRVRPWINKKICEYIGEEEKSLVEFICEKVAGRADPKKILDDLAMVLDDEAEVFMIKLWRLIIFESEAKKLGLNAGPSSGSSKSSSNISVPAF